MNAAPYLAAGPSAMAIRLQRTVDYIARNQRADGAIAWFDGGIVDPWDHVEAAMGLTVGGRYAAARRAYRWLAGCQRKDGSWLAAYQGGQVLDASRSETNFVAYVASGVRHYWLATGDRAFLLECWPMVKQAIGFVLSLQAPTGEIWWARDTRTGISHDALVTGCSSIYKSLESALAMAADLGCPAVHAGCPATELGCPTVHPTVHWCPTVHPTVHRVCPTGDWANARNRLGTALRERPDRFDRTWESKRRYSMDWFYPVLCGVHTGLPARERLAQHWQRFVVEGRGCRCVADRPWVTVAESCELVLALVAAGERERAIEVFKWLQGYQAEDGSWWTGYEYVERVYWPEERPTWTAAAVLLAADALYGLSGASQLFTAIGTPARSGAAVNALQYPQRTHPRPFDEQA